MLNRCYINYLPETIKTTLPIQMKAVAKIFSIYNRLVLYFVDVQIVYLDVRPVDEKVYYCTITYAC